MAWGLRKNSLLALFLSFPFHTLHSIYIMSVGKYLSVTLRVGRLGATTIEKNPKCFSFWPKFSRKGFACIVWRMEETFQFHTLDTTIYQTKYRSYTSLTLFINHFQECRLHPSHSMRACSLSLKLKLPKKNHFKP